MRTVTRHAIAALLGFLAGLAIVIVVLLAVPARGDSAALGLLTSAEEYEFGQEVRVTIACTPGNLTGTNLTCQGGTYNFTAYNVNFNKLVHEESGVLNASYTMNWTVKPKMGVGTWDFTVEYHENGTLLFVETQVKVVMGETYRNDLFFRQLHAFSDTFGPMLSGAVSALWLVGVLVLVVLVVLGLVVIAAIAQRYAHERNVRGPLDRVKYWLHLTPDPLGELWGPHSGAKVVRLEMLLESASLKVEEHESKLTDARELLARTRTELVEAMREGTESARATVADPERVRAMDEYAEAFSYEYVSTEGDAEEAVLVRRAQELIIKMKALRDRRTPEGGSQ